MKPRATVETPHRLPGEPSLTNVEPSITKNGGVSRMNPYLETTAPLVNIDTDLAEAEFTIGVDVRARLTRDWESPRWGEEAYSLSAFQRTLLAPAYLTPLEKAGFDKVSQHLEASVSPGSARQRDDESAIQSPLAEETMTKPSTSRAPALIIRQDMAGDGKEIERKTDAIERAVHDFVTALRLSKPRPVWNPTLWSVAIPFDDFLFMRFHNDPAIWKAIEQNIDFDDYGEISQRVSYPLETGDVTDIRKHLKLLAQDPSMPKLPNRSRSMEIAIARFNMAWDRSNADDRLIDLVIALEALYMNVDEEMIGSSVSKRASDFLEDESDAKSQLKRDIKNWYKARSCIAHVNEPPTSVDVERASRGLSEVVRRSIRKGLSRPGELEAVRRPQ